MTITFTRLHTPGEAQTISLQILCSSVHLCIVACIHGCLQLIPPVASSHLWPVPWSLQSTPRLTSWATVPPATWTLTPPSHLSVAYQSWCSWHPSLIVEQLPEMRRHSELFPRRLRPPITTMWNRDACETCWWPWHNFCNQSPCVKV